MDSKNFRVCKRCLTRDMIGQEAYFQNMYDYIENLDEIVKVKQPLYEKRLMVCKDCDLLTDGMCKACGCYVEMRAAMKKNACPYDKWHAYKE